MSKRAVCARRFDIVRNPVFKVLSVHSPHGCNPLRPGAKSPFQEGGSSISIFAHRDPEALFCHMVGEADAVSFPQRAGPSIVEANGSLRWAGAPGHAGCSPAAWSGPHDIAHTPAPPIARLRSRHRIARPSMQPGPILRLPKHLAGCILIGAPPRSDRKSSVLWVGAACSRQSSSRHFES